MKIDADFLTASALGATSPLKAVQQTLTSQSTSDIQSPFQVQLTSLVNNTNTVNSSFADVRIDKVNEISDRLANGTYNISSVAVAEKMLQILRS